MTSGPASLPWNFAGRVYWRANDSESDNSKT
jgi:hypothetical protein